MCYAFEALTVVSSIVLFLKKYTGLAQANINFLVIFVLINLSFAALESSLRAELLCVASRHQLSLGQWLGFSVDLPLGRFWTASVHSGVEGAR